LEYLPATGAEYGLLYSIINTFKNDIFFDYKLLVSGSHMDAKYGETINEIRNDNFKIEKIFKLKDSNKNIRAPLIISQLICKISRWLENNKIDIMLLYGDRFETFAVAIAASQMNVPIAHIEGGDVTNGGTLDDSVRHAISKLSHIHFTTNIDASKRLMSMGEEKWRIFTVGLPSNDQVLKKNYADKKEIEEKLKINCGQPIIIFTQHSVTTETKNVDFQINESINALRKLAENNFQIIITYPNNDTGGSKIINKLEDLKNMNLKNIFIYKSLGRYLYHGLLSLALDKDNIVICLGNSSSGIKETPFFKCPTINIGSRQDDRLRAGNIIDIDYDESEIIASVDKCVNSASFRRRCFEV
jgi:UDP-N-acetylglucosamine 2-epimerase (non-hydrolysing)/GDP/UDP-N,N'-diacetylbacillosamine 2-epimerase (hydrolysing)